MAQVIWAEPALNDLDAIADYIALDNFVAARQLVQKSFERADHLESHPTLGSKPQELKGWRYRQIVEPPCRIFYREDSGRVLILHVIDQNVRSGPNYLAIEINVPAELIESSQRQWPKNVDNAIWSTGNMTRFVSGAGRH